MSQDDTAQGGELLSRLKLDVKALTLLYGSDSGLKGALDKAFTDSGDPELARFVDLLQRGRKRGAGGSMLISLGELVLASFLTILGIAAFVPSLVGILTPHQLIDYLSSAMAPSIDSGPLYVGAPVLDFLFAFILVLSAFYTLRQASRDIRESSLALGAKVR